MGVSPGALGLDRVRSGRRGDAVIELLGSLSGEKPRARETARSLKLDRPHDKALGHSSDRSFVGRALKYPHLFRVIVLGEEVVLDRPAKPRPKHRKQPPAPADSESDAEGEDAGAGRLWGALMNHDRYGSEDRSIRGDFFEFPDEEYVQVEVDEDGGVVLWSSDLSVDQVISNVHRIVGSPSSDEAGYISRVKGPPHETSSADAEANALSDPDSVLYFVAGYGLASVSWRTARVKLRGGQKPWVECSIAGRHLDVKTVSQLLDQMGSAHVREAISSSTSPIRKALGTVATN